MIRRILILILTFMVLLAGFLAYNNFYAGGPVSISHKLPPTTDPAVRQPLLVKANANANINNNGAPEFKQGKNPHVEVRDKSGRLQYVLEAPTWNRDTDGSWLMESPVFTMYLRNGTIVRIRGDSGHIFAEEVKGSVKVNSGTLKDNVKIVVDRHGGLTTTPLDQRPRQDRGHDGGRELRQQSPGDHHAP